MLHKMAEVIGAHKHGWYKIFWRRMSSFNVFATPGGHGDSQWTYRQGPAGHAHSINYTDSYDIHVCPKCLLNLTSLNISHFILTSQQIHYTHTHIYIYTYIYIYMYVCYFIYIHTHTHTHTHTQSIITFPRGIINRHLLFLHYSRT